MGFNDINQYKIGNFDSIKEKLNTSKAQDIYYQKWMRNYSEIFKSGDDLNMIDWKLREWRAIKEIFAAAILYKEAKISLENRCIASYYFSSYYSLFHAMLSAICLDTNITLEKISDINHSKVGNQFKNTFCHGKNSILSEEIYTFFNESKYLREYYSYTLPFNITFYKSSYLEDLKKFIIQCFQLTNLQSLILEKSNKHGRSTKIITDEQFCRLIISLNKLVAKPDINGRYILDSADENVRNEIIRYGIDFQFILLQLDHIYDEFRTYDDSSEFFFNDNAVTGSEIFTFVYDTLR
ncbi:hypothetical protein ACRTAO_001131 [Clostridium perfringens]